MKIIKSKSYMKKEAIFSLPTGDLPVGDPGLPGELTERDISERMDGPEEDSVEGQQGEIEISVNWEEFRPWYEAAEEMVPNVFAGRISPSTLRLNYIYSYDYNNNTSSDIKPIKIFDYETRREINDPYFMQALVDYYEDTIKKDIDISEEDAQIERTPGYNPFAI